MKSFLARCGASARLARIAHVIRHFFASAVMAMIHDAYANEKNVVTCEERSFFKQCAIGVTS